MYGRCGWGIVFVMMVTAPVLHGQSESKRQARDTMEVSASAYCISGKTRSGTPTRPGVIAADPRVLPLGTVVRIDGLSRRYNGRYTVADTGRSIKGREIDIFVRDCKAAKRFGRQTARVEILQRPPKGEG